MTLLLDSLTPAVAMASELHYCVLHKKLPNAALKTIYMLRHLINALHVVTVFCHFLDLCVFGTAIAKCHMCMLDLPTLHHFRFIHCI